MWKHIAFEFAQALRLSPIIAVILTYLVSFLLTKSPNPNKTALRDSFLIRSQQRDLINHLLAPWHHVKHGRFLFYDVFRAEK